MTLNSIVANFQTFKLVDLLDILIIAFLIYQLLGIVNRTRAGQLAKGALLVLVAIGAANMWAAIFADVGVMVLAVLNATRALYTKNLIQK